MAIGDIDLYSILQSYDEKEPDGPKDQASETNSADGENKALQTAIRENIKESQKDDREDDIKRLEELQKHKDAELGEMSYDIDNAEYQQKLVNQLLNSLTIKNAQKVIVLSNRDNVRRGLTKDAELDSNRGLNRLAGKNQMSTVAIPTQLLRYVQQEIGGLSTKVTQNDVMTGFLYWYFGRPEDISFDDDPVLKAKMDEIISNLDLNASPSKFNRLNYNTTNTLLERLDTLGEQIDLISSLMTTSSRDSLENKTKVEKMYIALSYMILNFLAFTPPVMPGQSPEDLDLLANGGVWDLMSAVDMAYDYFKTKNGREIYKSKMHKKVNTFSYTQQVVESQNPQDDIFSSSDEANSETEYYGDDYDEYEDVDMGDAFDDIMNYANDYIDPNAFTDKADQKVQKEKRTLDEIKSDRSIAKNVFGNLNVTNIDVNGFKNDDDE